MLLCFAACYDPPLPYGGGANSGSKSEVLLDILVAVLDSSFPAPGSPHDIHVMSGLGTQEIGFQNGHSELTNQAAQHSELFIASSLVNAGGKASVA